MRTRVYTSREFCRILKANGYLLHNTTGSHYVYKHPITGKTISINLNLNKMVARRLIKENNLSEEA